ncbi:MAG: type II toxin-antitoxin system MqsA family antitoxin [Spirochaetales bacterium]|jgi:DNA-binding transcriptional regulator YiaG|nr:type II toxin-antitoxin system MqsA family antitoxin [Spirochaetales bacterium]
MTCTNCFEAEYTTDKTELVVTINGQKHILHDLDCKTCPVCGDINFTHAQSLEIDKKRIALEFGVKPLLTPDQLKTLRRILNMKLDEICAVLHIGRNSYGRWERGEVEITPSMNLLVHNLIDKVPAARVNLLESERIDAIEMANAKLLGQYISFGAYIREMMATTNLLLEFVCTSVGIEPTEFTRIQNNDMAPEKIPAEVLARIARFFRLTSEGLKLMLNETLKVITFKSSVTAAHTRSTCYDAKGAAIQASSINKIMEKLAQKKEAEQGQGQVSQEYLDKVSSIMARLNQAEE